MHPELNELICHQSAAADLPESTVAQRILADIYLHEEDYQNAIATSENGLGLLRRHEADTSEKLLQ